MSTSSELNDICSRYWGKGFYKLDIVIVSQVGNDGEGYVGKIIEEYGDIKRETKVCNSAEEAGEELVNMLAAMDAETRD